MRGGENTRREGMVEKDKERKRKGTRSVAPCYTRDRVRNLFKSPLIAVSYTYRNPSLEVLYLSLSFSFLSILFHFTFSLFLFHLFTSSHSLFSQSDQRHTSPRGFVISIITITSKSREEKRSRTSDNVIL